MATNVSLSGTDLSINDTDMQTIKLMSVVMESRAQDGSDDFGNFLQGDGTSFGGKAPNGLANTIDNKLHSVVTKLGYMLETLVRPSVLAF